MRLRLPRLGSLAPAVALLTVSGLLATGLAIALYIDRSNAALRISEVTVQARTLAATVPAALAFNDREAAREYVNAVRANPDVEQAAVYDASGALFVFWSRPNVPDPPRVFHDSPPAIRDGRLIVTEPVLQNQTQIGGVYLESEIEPLARRLQRYGLIGSLVSMAVLFVGMLGFSQRELTRANTELARQADDLAAANTSLREEMIQREKAEAALRQSQKMEAIGQLTGGVAHDFNNLLQVILGNLERLMRRGDAASSGAELTRMVGSAMRAAQRAALLTQRLLAFSRRQPLVPKPLDVNRLVSGMLELITRTIGEPIEVQTRLGGGVWRSFADENQLESALLNLAVNARDAMSQGGELIIQTSNNTLSAADAAVFSEDDARPGDYVLISVTDTGTGMPPEVLARVFEPFFTTKDIGQGTGLGLSQVYGFVRQSGGLVRVESEVGRGTRVNIYLPRLELDEPVLQRSAGPETPPAGHSNEEILLVEDQEGVRSFTAETLRELGYRVTEAQDALEALALLRGSAEVDLLLTDIGLPGGIDGRALAAEAARLRPGLKVLFATGYSQIVIQHGRMELGLEVVSKPFTRLELARLIRAILDRQPVSHLD